MHQVEEVPPPLSINLNGTLLKTEVIDQPIPTPTPISIGESLVAPPSNNTPVPIAPAQPILTSTPTATIKKVKRGFRTYLNNKKLNRSSTTKPATLLARPANINTATILPNSQKPVLIANPITPIIPKTVPANSSPGFTTYLVFDGGQGQLVKVANDGPKPVTFRNQSGQMLQATPITVVSPTNQPIAPTFPINSDCSLLSNSSQTITTVRTSSSIDMQQQTTLTSDTTTLTTQQLTGFIQQPTIVPTTILNGNNIQTYNNQNSSLDESRVSTNNNLSLSLSQIAEKVSHRHRRSSSSSTSKKKRGRPRLYERDPFTNKPIKSDSTPPTNELPNTTLLIPGQTATFNSLPTHGNSLIFSNQTAQLPVSAPSLLQQHQYSYPSLLNGSTTTTYNTFPYASQPITKEYTSPSYSSIPPTTNSNIPPFNSSPVKSSNNEDVTVHYIGGYVIRESNQPFTVNENGNSKEHNEQLRCVICEKMDISQRFFDQEKKFCSRLCSLKSYENKTSLPTVENHLPPQLMETNFHDQIPLPPDHGLPNDPSKWTVSQVGEFIARLTNETIRETFYESEMDGQALLLMTPEHLRETLKIKLGPSLVIASEIDKLRERTKTFSS